MKAILRNAATSEQNNKERIPMADSPSNTQVSQQPLISGDHFVTATRDCRGHLPGAEVLRASLALSFTTKSSWEITAKAFIDMKTMKKKKKPPQNFLHILSPLGVVPPSATKFSDPVFLNCGKDGEKNEGTKRKAGARQVELPCTSSTHPSRGQTSVQKKLCCRNDPRT